MNHKWTAPFWHQQHNGDGRMVAAAANRIKQRDTYLNYIREHMCVSVYYKVLFAPLFWFSISNSNNLSTSVVLLIPSSKQLIAIFFLKQTFVSWHRRDSHTPHSLKYLSWNVQFSNETTTIHYRQQHKFTASSLKSRIKYTQTLKPVRKWNEQIEPIYANTRIASARAHIKHTKINVDSDKIC